MMILRQCTMCGVWLREPHICSDADRVVDIDRDIDIAAYALEVREKEVTITTLTVEVERQLIAINNLTADLVEARVENARLKSRIQQLECLKDICECGCFSENCIGCNAYVYCERKEGKA